MGGGEGRTRRRRDGDIGPTGDGGPTSGDVSSVRSKGVYVRVGLGNDHETLGHC